MRSGNFAVAVLLLAAGGAGGWIARSWKAPAAEHDEEESAHVEPGDMSVEVVVQKATKGDLPIVLPVIGVVRADEGAFVTLGSRAGGRVAEVLVRVGDDVTKGAPILRYDEAPLRLAVAQAAGALASAANQLDEFDRVGRDKQDAELESAAKQTEADLANADQQRERVAALRKDGLASEKAESEARQAVDRARRERDAAGKSLAAFRGAGAELQRATLASAREAADATLADAKAVLAEAVVVAPDDGRVGALTAHLGDRVEPGSAVGTMLRPAGRVIVFGVTPAQVVGLEPGAEVVWTDAAGAERTATVRSIAADIVGPAGLIDVVAVPAGEGPPPRPGLVIRGEIETKRLAGVVLVSGRAVVRAEDKSCVVVVGDGGIARRVEVELLGRHGDVAAVKGEVKDGDRVVVEGAYNLPDGAKTHEAEADEKKDEHDDEKDKKDEPGTGK